MQENPLVSIIIYNYNYGKYLRECIDSALNQTYENIEIIMSDNSSDDDSWDIFVEYERQYQGKFFIARNRKNFGTDHNFATCWAVRKGLTMLYWVQTICLNQHLLKNYGRHDEISKSRLCHVSQIHN